MNAALILARIEARGGIAALGPDGRVTIGNISRLPPELMEEARRQREAVAALLAMRRGSDGDARTALADLRLGPVVRVEQLDHDAAEAAALVAHYAEPVALPLAEPASLYCFPCGKLVPRRDRKWSAAQSWYCAACCPAVAGASR